MHGAEIPKLADWREEARLSRVGRWFSERPEVEAQVAEQCQRLGIHRVLRWLIQFYQFPFSRPALTQHAIKAGWWTTL